MTESLLLAAAGAACGLVLGLIGIHALLSVNTAGLPRVGIGGELVRMDWRVVSANPAFQPGIPKPLFKTKARQARPDRMLWDVSADGKKFLLPIRLAFLRFSP
jgi:hypothetical protein